MPCHVSLNFDSSSDVVLEGHQGLVSLEERVNQASVLEGRQWLPLFSSKS